MLKTTMKKSRRLSYNLLRPSAVELFSFPHPAEDRQLKTPLRQLPAHRTAGLNYPLKRGLPLQQILDWQYKWLNLFTK